MVDERLPDAATLIQAAREAMSTVKADPLDREKTEAARRRVAFKVLNQWKPAIDEVTDLAGAAVFLGKRADTLKRRRFRARADGTPDWPKPDIEVGRTDGWSYRTIVLHQAMARGRGEHGSALAPVPDDAEVFLAVADIADHFGVAANTVHKWRARYRPGRTVEETARYPVPPQPEVVVGVKHPQAGWHEEQLADWDEWRASMPGDFEKR